MPSFAAQPDPDQGTASPSDGHFRKALHWLRKRQTGVVLFPWVLLALTNVAFKLWIFYSRAGMHPGPFEALAVLRWDLLAVGVVLPLAVACLLAPLPQRWQVRLSVNLAMLFLLVFCVDVAIFQTLGTFVPLATIVNLLHWLVTTGDTHVLVVPIVVLVPLAFVVVIAAVAAWLATRGRDRTRNLLGSISFVVLGCFVVTGALAFVPHANHRELTPALPQIAAQQAFVHPAADVAVIGKTLPELMQWYRSSAKVPPSDATYAGAARGYNVVFFVMESLPAEVFDPAGDVRGMPNVAELRKHSFVGRQHYTTYPYTSYALFAMLTSMYTQTSPGTLIEDPKLEVPGLVRALRESGYTTGYYGFLWKNLYSRDDRMLASLGFEKFGEPSGNPNNDLAAKEMYVGPAAAAESHDSQALALMRADIHGWAAKQQPFLAAYFPELGHDPWRDLQPGSHRTPVEIGHALAVRHDQWLGELMSELQADGILDKTIIVVTSDHGERLERASTGKESVTISPDRLDNRVFRVPLLVYVPGVLSETKWIDGPTSHIDLQPTVLSMLGIHRDMDREQGSEIWNPLIAERRLFLATIAAEGFCSSGSCYSVPGLGPPERGSGLDFEHASQLASDSPEGAEVKHVLAEHHALQHAILDLVLHTSKAE
jgi:membrane-anchored protein YejM (alkaline phosphatase superfamily)